MSKKMQEIEMKIAEVWADAIEKIAEKLEKMNLTAEFDVKDDPATFTYFPHFRINYVDYVVRIKELDMTIVITLAKIVRDYITDEIIEYEIRSPEEIADEVIEEVERFLMLER
jgi:hypothetical protein